MAAVVAVPAAFYLLAKPRSEDAGAMIEVADLGHLAEGKPQEVVYTRTRVDGWKQVKEKTTAWVVKAGKSDAIAYSPQCTHLGCAYHWEEATRKFKCPCHNFRIRVGWKRFGRSGAPSLRPAGVQGRRRQTTHRVRGGSIVATGQVHV